MAVNRSGAGQRKLEQISTCPEEKLGFGVRAATPKCRTGWRKSVDRKQRSYGSARRKKARTRALSLRSRNHS